jgi:hypothetical protein
VAGANKPSARRASDSFNGGSQGPIAEDQAHATHADHDHLPKHRVFFVPGSAETVGVVTIF